MERDELSRQCYAIAGMLQYQVLGNLDAIVAPLVQDGSISREVLETTVKKPIMQAVSRIKSLRVVTQNPALERRQ